MLVLQCCISDIEGAIGLWQIGLGSNFNKPIMVSAEIHALY